MKIENTLEWKIKFFALYWEQPVCSSKYYGIYRETFEEAKEMAPIDEYTYLELRPLSDITDEECKEIGKILKWHSPVRQLDINNIKSRGWINEFMSYNVIDYLRSHSFATPFIGVTVETMIEWGWIKLREL